MTPENVANGAQKLTEALGYKTAGVFFQPPERVAAARAEATPTASVDPALFVAQAPVALQRERPQADISDQARQGPGRHGHRRLQGEAVGGD